MTLPKKLPIVELFGPTLQGEGSQVGLRTMFIRLGYCDGAGENGWCIWCDSMFAVDPKNKDKWEWMFPLLIVQALRHISGYCNQVTISGGNPCVHDLFELVKQLTIGGYSINVETQGTIYKDWLQGCNTVTVSPKPPSAGSPCNYDRLDIFMDKLKYKSRTTLTLKIVIDPYDLEDYTFAEQVFSRYPWVTSRYISVLTLPVDESKVILDRYRYVADRVLNNPQLPDVAVLPQLHVLLWGHQRRM